MNKIKVGDTVMVIAGKDKGRIGKITKSIDDGDKKKFIVENVNVVKKHRKGSGIMDMEKPIHCSNVGLINPQTNKPEKIGVKYLADANKVRYFKKSNEIVDIKK